MLGILVGVGVSSAIGLSHEPFKEAQQA